MKKIEAIIRPQKLTETIKQLKDRGITGFTVSQVVGRGQEADGKGVYRGQNYKVTLHPKVKLEIVLSDFMVDATIETITRAAQTGENGDGKIYVYPILEAFNIRTGEPDTTVDDLIRGKE
ncbi:P-II family nitrogen regulator [Bacillus solitudinis]|uniref:P-II family nitrogen regulator n=1 Tax=Bacillus solitudinis TaxID=2014074 RepID=UPI000C249371|nr:P-II family nitrogen regulator [Bacillus solitudinis]